MAYTKQTWACGDTITAEKLNHMEDGISQGGGIETNIQNPTDGQTLKYDAESGKWVNGEGGSAAPLIVNEVYDEASDQTALDKTWKEIHDAMPNALMKLNETDNEYFTNILGTYSDADSYRVFCMDMNSVTGTSISLARYRTNSGKANHLLTGVIYCGKCGSKMFWKSTKVRGREYSYYTCKIYSQTSVYFTDSVKKCDNRQVRADEAEAKVIEVLSKLKLEDIKKEPRPVDNTKQIEAIEKRIERAAELYVMDGVSIEATRRLVADLSEKKAKLEAEMAEQPAYKAQEDALRDLPRVLSSDDESLRNRAVKALVKRVTVTGLDIDIQLNF